MSRPPSICRAENLISGIRFSHTGWPGPAHMQKLLVLQSMWAMERRHTDGRERSLEQNIEMIVGAGFDGISMSITEPALFRRAAQLLDPAHRAIEAQCFPRTVGDLQPVLDLCTSVGVHHLDVQADVRPRRIEECVPLLEGW